MSTVYNFNAGPAMLPPPVLEQVQAELRDYQGRGMSIMEMSHRSSEFEAINAQAETAFKRLLGVGDGYRVLFVQGGASTQFAMVSMNFLPPGATADYLMTGAWAEKAYEEAAALGQARVAASTKGDSYRRVPRADEIRLSAEPAYVHITSNETIQGIQWHAFPDVGSRPLVGDMSSDILSRPIDAGEFALIYAGAQKNLGPSEALEKQFVAEAQQAGMVGLAGHRSVGGIRASIYNAVSPEACQTLAAFITDFARRNG